MKKQILETVEEVFKFKPEIVAGVVLFDAGYTEEDFFDKTHRHGSSPSLCNSRNSLRDASRNFPDKETINEVRQWIKKHNFTVQRKRK